MKRIRRRLIGFNIHAPVAESSVISVTETTFTTVADDGNTYSLDSPTASIRLPDLGTISVGWSISVTCTFAGRYVLVLPGDVGLAYFQYDGGDCDGVSLDAIGASVVITFGGTYYNAPLSANVYAYAV